MGRRNNGLIRRDNWGLEEDQDLFTDPVPKDSSEDLFSDPVPKDSSKDLFSDPVPKDSSEDQFTDPVPKDSSNDLFSDPVPKDSIDDLFSDPVTKDSLFATEELFDNPVRTGIFLKRLLLILNRQPESENKLDDEGSADASRPRKDTNASDSSRKTDDTLFASTSPQELQSTPVPHHTVFELKRYPPKHDNVSRFPLSALQGAEPPASAEGGPLDSTTDAELQQQGSDHQHCNSNTRRTKVTYAPYTVSEGGFIKTDVATPHIISSRLAEQSSKETTQIFDTSYVHQHTALSSIEDDDAQFLEDFIDGPT